MAQNDAEEREYLEYLRLKSKQAAVDEPVASKPSGTESFLRGMSQGATFNFQDELSPYVEKGIGILTGNEAYKNRNIEDLRNTYREQNQAAQKAAPGKYLSGQIVGGLAPTAPLMVPAVAAKIPILAGITARGAPSVAGQIFTKEGAKIIGNAALKGAAEGAAIGAVSGAGAAEKDKLKGAGEGGLWGAILGGASSAVLKPVADVASKYVSKFVQSLQNLDKKTEIFLRNNPELIESIKAGAKNKNEAIADISDDVAVKLSDSFNKIVSEQSKKIDDVIQIAGNTPVDAKKVINAFDNEIAKLRKGGISRPVKQAISELEQMKADFVGKGKVNAETVNVLRKEVNALAQPEYQASIGDNPVLAKSASVVGNALRETLDDVDEFAQQIYNQQLQMAGLPPEKLAKIRDANAVLREVITARDEVASGFQARSLNRSDNRVDPADVQKILTRLGAEGKATFKKDVEKLSKISGIDIPKFSETVHAIKTIATNQEQGIAKSMTGRSLLAPAIGAALGGAGAYGAGGSSDNMVGLGALGFLLGAGAQSKIGMNALMNKDAYKVGLDAIIDQFRRSAVQQKSGDKAIEFEGSKITPSKEFLRKREGK